MGRLSVCLVGYCDSHCIRTQVILVNLIQALVYMVAFFPVDCFENSSIHHPRGS